MRNRRPPTTQVYHEKAPKWIWFLLLGVALVLYFYVYQPLTSDTLPDMEAVLTYVERPTSSEKSVLVDTRPAAKFREDSIPGSVNIPEGDFAAGYLRFLGSQIEGFTVIVYGDVDRPDVTELIARRLIAKKVPNMQVYLGKYSDLSNKR